MDLKRLNEDEGSPLGQQLQEGTNEIKEEEETAFNVSEDYYKKKEIPTLQETPKEETVAIEEGTLNSSPENPPAKPTAEIRKSSVKKEKTSFSIPFLNSVSVRQKVFFFRELAIMMNASVPLLKALEIIGKQVKSPALKKALDSILNNVSEGSTLSSSMAKFPRIFDEVTLSMISLAESNGTVSETLKKISSQMEKSYRVRAKIKRAMLYPVIITVVIIAAAFGLVKFIMPKMQDLYKGFNVKLPFLTQVLISTNNFMNKYILFFIAGFVLFIILLRTVLRTKKGRFFWDGFKIRIPIIGSFLKMVYMQRFCDSLSALFSTGVPILKALEIVSKIIGNVVYEDAIIKLSKKVTEGVSLGKALAKDPLFPEVINEMMNIGEETGETSDALDHLNIYYNEEIENITSNATALVEPFLIIFVGAIVAVILVAVMLPVYSLVTVIAK